MKIISHIGGARTKEQAIENAKIIAQGRNHLYNMPLSVEGVTSAGYDGYEYWYPVLSQEKLRLIPREELSTFEKEIAKFGQRIGISSSAPMSSVISESYVPENQYWSLGQRDFKPENIGFTKDGTLMGFDLHKSGGKIHIKKENRGKFTSYCGGKVTNECIARGKNSPNPAIRKRATFAANSRSWAKKRKNENGGIINWWKKVN